MHLLNIFAILILMICCGNLVNAQQPDCRQLRLRCDACTRRLNDPANNVQFMNDGCRQKVGNRYRWINQTRCDLQVIACGAHTRKLDCVVIAELAGMPRRT
ncbi:uncharacterized protein Dwil_GK20707 [Drosophila willistoni]|uniref:Uncharacterized protein n=1 Tax=Drosophila willistoni TaxID=7260 RepID=B4MX61_DROWI|nr:uncharacterized protein LOC6642975 [Drosophila willistoni]EDW76894.1 uncharacterized protein Dwil_GK20707 [Drosophila willistoni]